MADPKTSRPPLFYLYLIRNREDASVDASAGARVPEPYRLSERQYEFLLDAIAEEEQTVTPGHAAGLDESAAAQSAQESKSGQEDKRKEAVEAIARHMEMTANIENRHGLRELYCANVQRHSSQERKAVGEHIYNAFAEVERAVYPQWYDDSPLTGLAGEDPPEVDSSATAYNFDFMDPNGDDDDEDWPTFAGQADDDASGAQYFANKWSIAQLEDLRKATIKWYYLNYGSETLDEDEQVRRENNKMERIMTALEDRETWVREDDDFAPLMGPRNEWRSHYRRAIEKRWEKEEQWKQDWQDGADQETRREAALKDPDHYERYLTSDEDLEWWETKTRHGPANDVFVWRLVVVHLRALRVMGVPHYIPVTDCFDMDTLVDNVAHLIKYRRCIKWAKSMYQTAGVGSLFDQCRAGLLNLPFAHEHQDQSNTEMGIARRIIRQAHVANYVQYMYRPHSTDQPDVDYKARETDVRGWSHNRQPRGNDHTYRTDKYLTNPPMAPIMCTAPPRMGKSALSMLMASFAVKMGGTVHYGVAPNKLIPEADTQAKIAELNWVHKGGMLPGEIRVYSHDDAVSVRATNKQLQSTANRLTGWTLHIRDEAQYLVRAAKGDPNNRNQGGKRRVDLNEELENSFPLFYGLNMCVSATLMPVMCLGPMVGNDESIRDLLDQVLEGGVRKPPLPGGAPPQPEPIDEMQMPHWQQCVVLQPWSFPTGPNFLVPPRSVYPTDYPSEDEDYLPSDKWYEDYYDPVDERGQKLIPARTTNYYGTWFYVEEAWDWDKNRAMLLEASDAGVLIDSTLEQVRKENKSWVDTMLGKGKGGTKHFSPLAAFGEYLKNFNKHNTTYWDERQGQRRADAAPRVANWPIECLTPDAARLAYHAQQWLNESPREFRTDTEHKYLHPMLISAPHKHKGGKNGRLEWAALLCKLAWLRMHKDYVGHLMPLDITPDDLAKRYGLTVLIYASDKTPRSYEYVIARPEDIHIPADSKRVIAITFDPRLPENRFANYRFTDPGLTGENRGRLLPSLFVPTLTPAHVSSYRDAYDSSNDGVNAYDYVRDRVRARLYRFDMTRCYRRCGQAAAAAAGGAGPSSGPAGGGAGPSSGPNDDDDPSESDEDEEEYEDEEPAQDEDEDENEDSDSGDDGGWLHRTMRPEQLNRNSMNAGGRGWGPQGVPLQASSASATFDDWNVVVYDDDRDRDADEADDLLVDDCAPVGPNGDPDDGPNAPPAITDLNGIALRLCVTGFGDAQEATKASLTKCNIVKIAAIGYQMFGAGLTLQATIGLPGEQPPEKHMFVPMFMSIAPNQVNDRRDLSLLYQLIGRGFVDMKDEQLPKEWKLNLLATANTRNLCKLYGNVELLLSQVENESLEGRKMTLGALLRAIKLPTGTRPYEAVYNYALRGKDDQKVMKNMLECLGIQDRDDDEDMERDEILRLDRPFHNVRDCLTGRCLTGRYAPDLYPVVNSAEEQQELSDELFYRGRRIVDHATMQILSPNPDDCYQFPHTSRDLPVWRDSVLRADARARDLV